MLGAAMQEGCKGKEDMRYSVWTQGTHSPLGMRNTEADSPHLGLHSNGNTNLSVQKAQGGSGQLEPLQKCGADPAIIQREPVERVNHRSSSP